MLINFLKFIHVLLILSLLGSAIYCLILVSVKKSDHITRLNKIILALGFFAALTGTLLVIPKHFTFHTPWIEAAYILIGIFCFGILFLAFLKMKGILNHRWLWLLLYGVLVIILIGIIHDAVTKTTFLF